MASFKSAFASARKAGKKEFTWEGKSYNTELKETVRPKARGVNAQASPSEVRPKARPSSGSLRPRARPSVTRTSERPSIAAKVNSPSVFSSENPDFESRQKARRARRKGK